MAYLKNDNWEKVKAKCLFFFIYFEKDKMMLRHTHTGIHSNKLLGAIIAILIFYYSRFLIIFLSTNRIVENYLVNIHDLGCKFVI